MAPNKKVFALKRVSGKRCDPEIWNGFLEEVELLKQLKGRRHIIQLVDMEVIASEKLIYVVLQHGEIDLNKLLQRKRREWAAAGVTDPFMVDHSFISDIWQQMLRAVRVCVRLL